MKYLKLFENIDYKKGDYLLTDVTTTITEKDLRALGYHIDNKIAGIKPIKINFAIVEIITPGTKTLSENLFTGDLVKLWLIDENKNIKKLTDDELSEQINKVEEIIKEEIENHNIGDFAKKYNM